MLPVQVAPPFAVAATTRGPPVVPGGPTMTQVLGPEHAIACTLAVEAGRFAPSFVQVFPPSVVTSIAPGAVGWNDPAGFGPLAIQVVEVVQLTAMTPFVPPLIALGTHEAPPFVLTYIVSPAAMQVVDGQVTPSASMGGCVPLAMSHVVPPLVV